MFYATVSKMVSKKVVILGGGISALSLAWFLKKKHKESIHITLLEKSSRLGGWIKTSQQEGFLFEHGPRGCRPHGNGIATLQLIEELGLQDQVIINHPSAKRRFIFREGNLQALPSGLGEFVAMPWLMKLILKPLLVEGFVSKGQGDESVHDFFSRRLSEGVADNLIDPLVTGIYAGDVKKLSMKSCFPKLHEWEQEKGSLIKGFLTRPKQKQDHSQFVSDMQKHSLFSFKSGMETLVKTLSQKIDAKVILNTKVQKMTFVQSGVIVDYVGGRIEADEVYSTISANALAELLQDHDGNLADELASIKSTSVVVVSLGYLGKVLKHSGFGYLIPSKEKEKILGMVWDSCVFPEQNCGGQTRLSVMLGGEHHLDLLNLTESELVDIAMESVQGHLGVVERPANVNVYKAVSAIPQYVVGHSERVKKIRNDLARSFPRLKVLGTSFEGVAVNDCIFQAQSCI